MPIATALSYAFFQDCSDCGALVVMETTFPLYWGHYSVIEADMLCLSRLTAENQGYVMFLLNSIRISA